MLSQVIFLCEVKNNAHRQFPLDGLDKLLVCKMSLLPPPLDLLGQVILVPETVTHRYKFWNTQKLTYMLYACMVFPRSNLCKSFGMLSQHNSLNIQIWNEFKGNSQTFCIYAFEISTRMDKWREDHGFSFSTRPVFATNIMICCLLL